MKTENRVQIGNPLAASRSRGRRIFGVLGLIVCVLAAGQRGRAQVFPAQGDDTTGSMGVFRVTVSPAFRSLMNPAGALVSYTGYNTTDGKLTSPLCIDNATTIGRA